jgi:hypothetical protein
MTNFTVTNLKTLDGNENIAFQCNLCANRKTIARVTNTGTGGSNDYDWKSVELREEFEPQVTDELVWELIEAKLPPQYIEIETAIAVFENQRKKAKQLADITAAIAQELGDGWTTYIGGAGMTCVGHRGDGYEFNFYIASGAHGADPCYKLCVGMPGPEHVQNAPLTKKEKEKWKIPDFDLRTDTPQKIAVVLRKKLKWLKSILPQLEERALRSAESLAHVKQAGVQLSERLGLPFKQNDRTNRYTIERKIDNGFGEWISISFESQSYEDGTGSFSLSACRISDEKLLKLIEFCKELDI